MKDEWGRAHTAPGPIRGMANSPDASGSARRVRSCWSRVQPEESDAMMETNPRLREAYLEIVEGQLAMNEPPETRETLNRLISEGISDENARIYIAQVVAFEAFTVLKSRKPFNRERFVRNLHNLPDEPEE
jgi:hypothetical protein